MAQLTIAQMREKDVEYLAHFVNGEWNETEPTEEKRETAKRLMNSYYRLNVLCERNFYWTNDSVKHNKPWVKESEEREDKWYKRLKKRI